MSVNRRPNNITDRSAIVSFRNSIAVVQRPKPSQPEGDVKPNELEMLQSNGVIVLNGEELSPFDSLRYRSMAWDRLSQNAKIVYTHIYGLPAFIVRDEKLRLRYIAQQRYDRAARELAKLNDPNYVDSVNNELSREDDEISQEAVDRILELNSSLNRELDDALRANQELTRLNAELTRKLSDGWIESLTC